jgi:hypothetical protein
VAQGSRTLVLLAALALARRLPPVEAHAVLREALEGLAPTPLLPEIAQAQALLSARSRFEAIAKPCQSGPK